MSAGAQCAVTPADRIVRAVASVFLAGFALSSNGNLWCLIPAGICSAFLMIGAITGWCPTDLFARRSPEVAPNRMGFDEARQPIDV